MKMVMDDGPSIDRTLTLMFHIVDDPLYEYVRRADALFAMSNMVNRSIWKGWKENIHEEVMYR